MTHTTKGILFMIVHCLALSLIMGIMRQLGLNQVPIFLVMFWQNLVALLLVCVWCGYKKHLPRTKKFRWHFLRSLTGYASGTLLLWGLSMIKLNKATAISFTGPLFTTIFAVILLREKIGLHRITGLVVGFAGVLIVLRPGTEQFDIKYMILIVTAMLWGLTDIIIKILNRTESMPAMLFYTTLSMIFISAPMAILSWQEVSLENFMLLCLLACCHLLNFGSASYAYRHADLSVLMPFEFTRLIFSTIFSYLVFSEDLSPWTAVGSMVIVGGAAYVAYRERVKSKRGVAKTEIYESQI